MAQESGLIKRMTRRTRRQVAGRKSPLKDEICTAAYYSKQQTKLGLKRPLTKFGRGAERMSSPIGCAQCIKRKWPKSITANATKLLRVDSTTQHTISSETEKLSLEDSSLILSLSLTQLEVCSIERQQWLLASELYWTSGREIVAATTQYSYPMDFLTNAFVVVNVAKMEQFWLDLEARKLTHLTGDSDDRKRLRLSLIALLN